MKIHPAGKIGKTKPIKANFTSRYRAKRRKRERAERFPATNGRPGRSGCLPNSRIKRKDLRSQDAFGKMKRAGSAIVLPFGIPGWVEDIPVVCIGERDNYESSA